MKITREWSMPNKNTFSIKPINELITKYKEKLPETPIIVDPYANISRIANITNDIDPQYNTTYNIDATEFLQKINNNSVDMVLFDPPFSARQVSESYRKLGKSVDRISTSSNYWARQKKEISRICKSGAICISCAWNSGGIGKSLGFEIDEILLVAHGGWHNDTIVTVEHKI